MGHSLMPSDRCWKMPRSSCLLAPLVASREAQAQLGWPAFTLGSFSHCWCRLQVPYSKGHGTCTLPQVTGTSRRTRSLHQADGHSCGSPEFSSTLGFRSLLPSPWKTQGLPCPPVIPRATLMVLPGSF